MAEMVPVEFWEWAIPQVKQEYPNIIFIAEVYNPHEYKNYLFRGKFDFLYDKVGLYDTLRNVACGYDSATAITRSWQSLGGLKSGCLTSLKTMTNNVLHLIFCRRSTQRCSCLNCICLHEY